MMGLSSKKSGKGERRLQSLRGGS